MKYIQAHNINNEDIISYINRANGGVAVFDTVEEYKKFSFYVSDNEIEKKEKEIYTKLSETPFSGDAETQEFYMGQLKLYCHHLAKKYFNSKKMQNQHELQQSATKTNKALFVCADHFGGSSGDIKSCFAAFSNKEALVDYIQYLSNINYDISRIYVTDQTGKTIIEKGKANQLLTTEIYK